MMGFIRSACAAFWLLVCFSAVGYASRIPLSLRGAWADASVLMVRGTVTRTVTPVPGRGGTAYYEFRVSEVLRPRSLDLPQTITIADPFWNSTAQIRLHRGEEALLFLRGQAASYGSAREIDLDSPGGQDALRGLRLFLRVMFTTDRASQQEMCLRAWDSMLSDPEKQALLDAMWETRSARYSDVLLDLAGGRDSPAVRAWAITILSYINNSQHVEELVPLLLTDPDYHVKRQLLLLFGTYRVQAALTAINELLANSQQDGFQAPMVSSLRAMAEEARDKITGKNASSGWKN